MPHREKLFVRLFRFLSSDSKVPKHKNPGRENAGKEKKRAIFQVKEWTSKYDRRKGLDFQEFLAVCNTAQSHAIPSSEEVVLVFMRI